MRLIQAYFILRFCIITEWWIINLSNFSKHFTPSEVNTRECKTQDQKKAARTLKIQLRQFCFHHMINLRTVDS